MNNLNNPLSERFAAFVSTLTKPVQDNIEASYKRGESFTAQAFEAGWRAAQDDDVAMAEPIYQVRFEHQLAWNDASEDAYHTFTEKHRRIVYLAVQPIEKLTPKELK